MYKIPLSKPSYLSYTDEVCEAVNKVIRSGHPAMGEVTEEFEQRIADYTGCKYSVAVSSGTDGLTLCLEACGIGHGDEVITTPFSFIASSNVILRVGAKPVFVDINRDTYNIDENIIIQDANNRYNDKEHNIMSFNTKCVLPVDVFGVPVDTHKLSKIPIKSNTYGLSHIKLPVIIDSCESFGSKICRPFDCAVYAFYPNKQLCTGEGGIIVTNNKDIAEYCQAARNQGRKKGDQWLESSYIGYNYRMTDMQAAMGLVQLNHWDEILEKRMDVETEYYNKFTEHGLFELIDDFPLIQQYTSGFKSVNPFVFTIEFKNRYKVMQYMLSQGIECKPYFPCIHLQQPYREMGYHEGMYPVAEEVSSRTLALPFYTDMTESEVDTVCETLKKALSQTI